MSGKYRILVVENRNDLREQYITSLDLVGFEVEEAASLAEAFERLERKTYHVALVDLMLNDPEDTTMNGLEVLKKIKTLDEGTQAIVLSGQTSTSTAGDTISEYGAAKYISKEKIIDQGIEYLVKEVLQIADTVTLAKYGKNNVITAVLAGDPKNAATLAQYLLELKPKDGFTGVNNFLTHFCDPLVPLIPQRDASSPMVFSKEHHRAAGKFWSKGLGRAVELVVCQAKEADKVIKTQNNSLWQEKPLREYENYGLKGYVFRVSDNMTRSKFVE